MSTVLALANVVIKELYRRKDAYVLFVLTALITLLLGSVNFFNDQKIVEIVKDICLLLIWVSALIIAIVTAARQIPAEREARTIFPLLAKPVTRGQVIAGKFAGCWFATGIALLVFYLFFVVVTGSREHQWPLVSYLQAIWLQWMMLAVVIAMVLLGSIVFAAPSSNATISFVVVLGILFVGRYLHKVAVVMKEPTNTILSVIYFMIPHLEWYDVRQFVVFGHNLVPWPYFALVTVYAAAYTWFFLFIAWVLFRRRTLTV